MTKLSDTQAVLLSTASQRESGSLLPLPSSLKPGGGTAKAIAALASRGLAEERDTDDPSSVHRQDRDLRFGMFVTAAGLAAIGVAAADANAADAGGPPPQSPAAPRINKTTLVLDLLRRPDGATLAELIEVTGWLPHTTRAALTRLRKKGHAVERSKREGVTCYRIVAAG